MQLEPVDALSVTVLIDNTTDSLSTNPPQAKAEWSSQIARGRMRLLCGPAICCAHHGLSLLLEVQAQGMTRTLLFDAGPEAATLERNVAILDADLSKVTDVVLSHGHWDHAGGLIGAIRAISAGGARPLFHVHPGVYAKRGVRLASGIVLPMESVADRESLTAAGAQVHESREPELLAGGCFFLSGEIPRRTAYETGLPNQVAWSDATQAWEPDPLLMDERCLVVHVKGKGLVVFSACSHAGIVNVMHHVRETFEGVPIHAVFGGFHLSGSTEAVIPQTVADLAKFDIEFLAPGHCTGWRAMAAIGKECRGTMAPMAVGKRYAIGPSP